HRLERRALADRRLVDADGGGAGAPELRRAARVRCARVADGVRRVEGPLLDAHRAGCAEEPGAAGGAPAARAANRRPRAVLAPSPRAAAAVRDLAHGLLGHASRADAEVEINRAATNRDFAREWRPGIVAAARSVDDDPCTAGWQFEHGAPGEHDHGEHRRA